MTTLNELIQRELNPFDPITFKTGNFWAGSNQETIVTVDSIHASAIAEITETVNRVAQDNITRGVLLKGDRGSGKSYLLKRLKKQLNEKAFFAYIEPCPDAGHLWRHTLRYTVESLMHTPEGKKESQLLLWLKSLSALKQKGLLKALLGEKSLFIKEFSQKYPLGIYQAKEFFGVLYELIKTENFYNAYTWLKGDNLDEDNLKTLGVKSAIDNEEAARNILGNFGTIADSTYPVVLCFDQVELSPELPNGYLDITPVFKINTALHNAGLKNFVVIISIIRDVYRENEAIIPQADLDRLELTTELRNISLKQVQALWESRLYPLHAQATPKPQSSIAPLELSALESEYPGGKANLRDCLIFGGKLYKKYKDDLINSGDGEPQPSEPTEEFKLLWQHEFKNNQEEISKVNQFSGIELVNMLKKALTALEIKIIKQKLLSSPTYAGSSFSYLCPKSKQEIGIFWNESPNMQSLAFAMKACHKTLGNALCDSLILIRQEGFASQKGKAYSDYIQIFHMGANQHIKVDTESLHYLRTYQLLVNEAYSGNLVIGSQVINPEKLEELVRKSEVLKSCCLLQDLKIFGKIPPPPRPDDIYIEWVKTFLKVYQFMSRATLEKNIKQQFPQIQDEEIDRIVSKLLCEPSPFITILDTSVSKDEQLVCLIPQTDHVLSH